MAEKRKIGPLHKQISLLIVDDSLVFRKVLRDIFERTNSVNIIGEATNGIEALDMVLKLNPDVIIMDMEMPIMDGMTSLQHLMIHKPTPTIMFSSLTKEGTARSFDAIKNGAVDFVCKDAFFQNQDIGIFEKEIVYKVIYASKVIVRSVEPMFAKKDDIPPISAKPSDIIFCEECGARNIFEAEQKKELKELRCKNCGDLLEVNLINKYKRINYVTVIGTGLGGYSNLLRIIPGIPDDVGGAIIAIIYDESHRVDAFTDYLNAVSKIKVNRMADGVNLEGGNCYIASSFDNVYMKPYSAQYTIRRTKAIPGYGPVDLIMNSITSVFKDKVAGIVLSGSELDGEKGINAIKNNEGISVVLNSANCLCKEMGENILRKCSVDKIVDERDATHFIIDLHRTVSGESTAA
ncbi:MAG: response regulator [Desulfobulbaceae bacterium]|nr:MAG: response regulator [Desulfobulbaceae bacterium]